MGTLDTCIVKHDETDPVAWTNRLRRMLGFLSQLDLRSAERQVRLEPKFCDCAGCLGQLRAKDVVRVQGRPYCEPCAHLQTFRGGPGVPLGLRGDVRRNGRLPKYDNPLDDNALRALEGD